VALNFQIMNIAMPRSVEQSMFTDSLEVTNVEQTIVDEFPIITVVENGATRRYRVADADRSAKPSIENEKRLVATDAAL
jgi:hypothetical protein